MALVDDPDAAPSDPGTGREGTDILDDQPPVTVGQYFNPIEAYGHRMALEQAGVRAWVCDEHIGATYGVAIGTKLQVRAGDEAAARAILEMDSAAAPADLWSDMPDDVVEPPEAAAPTRPEPEAAAPEEPSVEQDRRFETLDLLGQMGARDGPDFDARWAAFFRQTGMAAVFPLESFFAAIYGGGGVPSLSHHSTGPRSG